MVIFLDYYHPYAGLCNQLYLITNHLVDAIVNKEYIYINKVNLDIFNKTRVPAEEFFDLETTNKNIKKYIGWEPIIYNKPLENFRVPRLCIYPVGDISILSCLEFKEKYKTLLKETYYGIHFRIEFDVIVHYLFSLECYNHFMLNQENLTLIKPITDYIDYLMDQYKKFICLFGFKTYFITFNNSEINKPLKIYLEQLINFIESGGGKVITFKPKYQLRELNALRDLLILRDCKKIIGFEGSSFSEGYCKKYNDAKNRLKDYQFVNGIVIKLNEQLYNNCRSNSSIC